MDHQVASEIKATPEQAANKTRSTIAKPKSDLQVLRARLRAEQKARLKAEEALAEAQETLSIAQTTLEQERRGRINVEQDLAALHGQLENTRNQAEEQKQARIKVEQDEVEADKALENYAVDDPMGNELHPAVTSPKTHSVEERLSYIIRLVADDHGRIKRYKTEHTVTPKKDGGISPNMQRLVDLITSTLSPVLEPVSPVQPEPISSEKNEQVVPKIAIAITNAQIVCTDENGKSSMIFKAGKPITLQILFQIDKIQEIDSLPEASWEVPCKIKVYAHRIDMQSATLIANETVNLVSGVHRFSPCMQISDLPAGLYRLYMTLHLQKPAKTARIVQGPFLKVIGAS